MSGAEGWDDIEAWGKARQAWLQQYLRLRNGIPGHDTIRRVFESLSPAALESRFVEWAQGVYIERRMDIDQHVYVVRFAAKLQ
jgi:hypothetical protein